MHTALAAGGRADYGACQPHSPNVDVPRRPSTVLFEAPPSPGRGVVHLDMRAVSMKLNVSETELARSLSRSPGDFFPRSQSTAFGRPSSYIVPSPFGGLSVGSRVSTHSEEMVGSAPGSPGPLGPQVVMVSSPAFPLKPPSVASRLLQPSPGLASLRLEIAPGREEDRIMLAVRYAEPIRAWCLLLTGLIAWSSTGPILVFFPEALKVRPLRIAFWRYSFGFCPFALTFLTTVLRGQLRPDHRRRLLRVKSWPVFSTLAVTTLAGFTCYGLSVAHCATFALAAGMSALNPFLLLLWQLSRGEAIGKWNWTGLGLAAVGTAGMLLSDRLQSVRGTLDGLGASTFFTMYVAAAEVLSAELPFTALMSITFGIGALLAGLSTFCWEGTTLASGPESVFGFMADSYVLTVSLSLAVAYTWGLTGLTASAKDLPPLVLAVAIALEPLCSVAIVAAAEHQAPSSFTTAAMVCLVAGSVVVGVAETLREKAERRVDVTDAALPWTPALADRLAAEGALPWTASHVDLFAKPSPS